MKPIRQAVAIVIHHPDHKRILIVQRPANDENLPNVWGLPATSLKKGESFKKAVLRLGREKLGVELKIIKLINEGQLEGKEYILFMKEYEVEIIKGKPKVPQKINGITQYQKWVWALSDKLKEAAQKGSLCSQLYLSRIKLK